MIHTQQFAYMSMNEVLKKFQLTRTGVLEASRACPYAFPQRIQDHLKRVIKEEMEKREKKEAEREIKEAERAAQLAPPPAHLPPPGSLEPPAYRRGSTASDVQRMSVASDIGSSR